MSILLAPLQMTNFQIIKSVFEVVNPENTSMVTMNISIQFSIGEIVLSESNSSDFAANLNVNVSPQAGTEGGYQFEAHVRASFNGVYKKESGTVEQFETYMRLNAFSLLYGLVRSHLQELSSMSPVGQINLACIDPLSVISEMEERSAN